MQNVIDPTEYAAAWNAYRLRWIITWLCLLAGSASGVVLAKYVPSVPGTLAVLACMIPFTISYLWFLRWRCPRCGERFTMADAHGLKRSKRCRHCGLAKDFIPDPTSYPVP
jgi:hypothetical protein